VTALEQNTSGVKYDIKLTDVFYETISTSYVLCDKIFMST
jgi:hypothetical protein